MRNLNEILKKLLQTKVDFVLVGGLAAAVYGVSTVTHDVDICCPFDPSNLQKLLDALKEIHPRVRTGSGEVSLSEYRLERLSQLENLYVRTDLGELDILGEVRGIGRFPEVKSQSTILDIFGMPCLILQLDSLIGIKSNLDRPKDKQVELELKVIREKTKK